MGGGGIGADDEEIVVGVKSVAFFTFDTLARTDNGVTSPTTVSFFAAKSMLKDVTPSILEMCFLIFLSHPLQCNDTLKTTTWSGERDDEGGCSLEAEEEEEEEDSSLLTACKALEFSF